MTKELPLYQSHKLVRALRIAAVEILQDGSGKIAPKDEGFDTFVTRPGWAERFNGYDNDPGVFVQYEDGFTSWSPSKAFNDGYLPVPDAASSTGKDEAAIEAEIQRKGLNAPRLTPDKIDAAIAGEAFYIFPGTTLTVCALTLRNGFTVTGESAAASPDNFDEEIGRKIARDNARQKIWAFEGYLLRERLHEGAI